MEALIALCCPLHLKYWHQIRCRERNLLKLLSYEGCIIYFKTIMGLYPYLCIIFVQNIVFQVMRYFCIKITKANVWLSTMWQPFQKNQKTLTLQGALIEATMRFSNIHQSNINRKRKKKRKEKKRNQKTTYWGVNSWDIQSHNFLLNGGKNRNKFVGQ